MQVKDSRISARASSGEDAIAARLGQADFFKGLPPDGCRRLARLCVVRTPAKKDTLFMEGQRGREVFFLVEGQILLHKATADGAEIVIRTIRPGEVFAEVILFEQDRYPVTATALLPCRVLAFDRVDFLGLLENARFRNEFIANLMRKQRYLAERVRYLTSCSVEQRFFLFLKEQHGEVEKVPIKLSKKDMAAAIGATPETFSRLLQRLRRGKRLQWKDRVLTLPPGFWRHFEAG